MNGLVMEDGRFFKIAEDKVRKELVEAFTDIRSYGIEPIPEMQSFGHAGNQISRDPRTAEGEWVRKERLVRKGQELTPLARRNVIRTRASDVMLAGEDGKTTYELGGDYEVLDGTLVPGHPDKATSRLASYHAGTTVTGVPCIATGPWVRTGEDRPGNGISGQCGNRRNPWAHNLRIRS